MKNVFKDLQKGITIGIGISLSLGLIGITYAAFVNITDVNPTDILTADLMNDVINNQKDLNTRIDGLVIPASVPSTAVMAFYSASCPTGWSPADGTNSTPDLRGTFVRGMNGNLNSRDISRTLGSYQADEIISHRHYTTFHHKPAGSQYGVVTYMGGVDSGPNWSNDDVYSSFVGGTETRPKNVALLYCIKD